MPLSALESLLPAGEFVRPIRYCLVALRHIKAVGEDALTMRTGEAIPIARRERESVRQQLAAWRLRQLRGR